MQRFKTNKNFPDALMLQALGMMSERSSTAQDCMICMEALNEDNPANHKCPYCTKGIICASCLREWFIDACKNSAAPSFLFQRSRVC
jgi:hypothetical protein